MEIIYLYSQFLLTFLAYTHTQEVGLKHKASYVRRT